MTGALPVGQSKAVTHYNGVPLGIVGKTGVRDLAAKLIDAEAELERYRTRPLAQERDRLRAAIEDAITALGPGEDEDTDSPGNMAHAILRSALREALDG